MRSSVFRDFADFAEDFTRDLQALWSLTPEQRRQLIPHVIQAHEVHTNLDVNKIVEDVVARVGGEPAGVLRAFKVLQFFYQQWNPVQDTADAFIADLKDLALLPPTEAAPAVEFLAEFMSAVQSDTNRRLERMYASSVLPNFSSVTAVVDLRPYFNAPFGSQNADIESYQPICLGVTPVIVVKLKRDSGLPLEFAFQCERTGLKMLIDTLRAAEKDLAASAAFMENRDAR